jgi:hypothetical protein
MGDIPHYGLAERETGSEAFDFGFLFSASAAELQQL